MALKISLRASILGSKEATKLGQLSQSNGRGPFGPNIDTQERLSGEEHPVVENDVFWVVAKI